MLACYSRVKLQTKPQLLSVVELAWLLTIRCARAPDPAGHRFHLRKGVAIDGYGGERYHPTSPFNIARIARLDRAGI